MAQILKVGNRNLSPYIRVAHDDGLDPANPEFTEPQFTGSPAFGEGQSFVGDAVNNRLMSYPLILSAPTTDALYQLIREINGELVKGAQVEYRSGGATQSTFFDLERGRLEPKFEFWIDQAAKVRAMLHLWVRPHGHTGTLRLVASLVGPGPQVFQATGIQGDRFAQGNLSVSASDLATGEELVVLYGVKYPVASGWDPLFSASRLATAGIKAATIVGASGRYASQYRAHSVDMTGMSSPKTFTNLKLRPQDKGAYRLFMSLRHDLNIPSAATMPHLVVFRGRNLDNAVATQAVIPLASFVRTVWSLVDLGEIRQPEREENLEFSVEGLGNGASAVATFPIKTDLVFTLPLDVNAGVFLDKTTAQTSQKWICELNAVTNSAKFFGAPTVAAPSGLFGDKISSLRGDLPKLPPLGTSMPSGPASILVMHTYPQGNSPLNRPIAVSLGIRESFAYLR